MAAGEVGIGEMRAFLEGVGHFLPPPPRPPAALMSDFLAEVRRLGADAPAPGAAASQDAVHLPRMAAFLNGLAGFVEDGSTFSATPDIWGIARLRRDEQRNAAVLAWVLDPRGSHGLGPAVLNAFVDILRSRWKGEADEAAFPFPPTVSDCQVRLEVNPFGDLSRRVDIALDGRDFTAFVEVKVGAPEGREQLATYLALAQRRAASSGRSRWGLVFLAPSIPAKLSAAGPRVLLATWADVAAAIRRVLPNDRADLARSMIRQFATHVAEH